MNDWDMESADEILTMTGEALLSPTDNTLKVWADIEMSDTFMGLMARTDWKSSKADGQYRFFYSGWNPMVEGKEKKEAWDEIHGLAP